MYTIHAHAYNTYYYPLAAATTQKSPKGMLFLSNELLPRWVVNVKRLYGSRVLNVCCVKNNILFLRDIGYATHINILFSYTHAHTPSVRMVENLN